MARRLAKVSATLFLTVIAVAQSFSAAAQTDQAPSLQKLTLTPQYQANISRLFAELAPDVFQRCPALISRGSTVTVIEPASFATDGIPVSGAWKQSFPISGCGNNTTINLFFNAQADERIISTVAAPGETHAGLVLQRDAARYALIAVRTKAPTCNDIHAHTTVFDGLLPDKKTTNRAKNHREGSAWRETWVFFTCGQFLNVPLTFIPDATGTVITAAPAVAAAP